MTMVLAYDFETTGVFPRGMPLDDPKFPWPVSVAAVLFGLEQRRGEAAVFYSLIAPTGWTIPAEATKVHGITDQNALECGLPVVDALLHLRRLMFLADVVVGHNAGFDDAIAASALKRLPEAVTFYDRAGLTAVERERWCTMHTARDLMRLPAKYPGGYYKSPRLSELYEWLFHKPMKGAHNALADVRAVVRITRRMHRDGVFFLPPEAR